MSDYVDKKIEKLEKSCYEIARNELKELKESNDINTNERLSLMIENYKDDVSKKYNDEMKKIDREYKRNIFDFEKNERLKIKLFKQELIEKIYSSIVVECKNYINTSNYKKYLLSSINNILNKFKDETECIIFITQSDYQKFGNEIKNKFKLNVEKIEDDNIGGCIILNQKEKISIDNTLKTNIQEEVNKINL